MRSIWLILIAIVLLVGCAPSTQAIQTAIAQTQEAKLTMTSTPVPPSQTPTETQTITPSPTPDLLVLQTHLKDFLLQLSDLPPAEEYYQYFIYMPFNITNDEVVRDDLSKYLAQTARIDSWEIEYEKGTKGSWTATIFDRVVLFHTVEGAQLAITKFTENTENEETYPPEIGDKTRAFYTRLPYSGGEAQGIYLIEFTYRNILHSVQGFGYETEVVDFVRNIARKLLEKLQSSLLLNP